MCNKCITFQAKLIIGQTGGRESGKPVPGLLLEVNNANLEFAISKILHRWGLDGVWPVCCGGKGSGEAKGYSQKRFKHNVIMTALGGGVKGARGCLSLNL